MLSIGRIKISQKILSNERLTLVWPLLFKKDCKGLVKSKMHRSLFYCCIYSDYMTQKSVIIIDYLDLFQSTVLNYTNVYPLNF